MTSDPPSQETVPTNRSRPLRVLLADDHPVVRDGLAAILAATGDLLVVAEAGDGRTAVELFLRERPDVGLIDLRMPILDGVGAIREIRRHLPQALLLVLTTFDGDEDIHRALEAGARGYLLKDAGREELVVAVRAVAAGRRFVPGRVAERLVEHGSRAQLTPRELDVLRLIAEGSSNKEIAQQLGLTEGTVKGYVNELLSKLAVDDRTAAVTVALKRGLISLR